MNKYGAEFFGTFWLVLGGCGSAVLAAAFPNVGIGLLGVSLAFGLTGWGNHGLRNRAHFGLPSQPGSIHRPLGRRTFSRFPGYPYIIAAQVLGSDHCRGSTLLSSPAARRALT